MNNLPKGTKNSLILGITLAIFVALPLFVWSLVNLRFDPRSFADEPTASGVPNYCGGTCGSHNNCQPNYFCFEGYCRSPICPTDTNCDCQEIQTASPTATSTAKATTSATVKPLMTASPLKSLQSASPTSSTTPNVEDQPSPNDQGFNIEDINNIDNVVLATIANYAVIGGIFLVAIFVVIVIVQKILTFKNKK